MDIQKAAQAIVESDVRKLRKLLEQQPQLATQSQECGRTLLHQIVDWPGGNPEAPALVSALLEAGADPNARFKGNGEAVLHWAASNSYDHEVIPILTHAGADLEISGGVSPGGTPLDNAVDFGKVKAAATLVACGAKIDNLCKAAGLGRINLLQQFREDLEKQGYRALSAAVFCLEFAAADWLLEQGLDIDHISEGADSTLLHQVAYRGRLTMAMYLVSRGANLDIPSPVHKGKPFEYGFVHAHPEIMNYLIDQGSRVSLEAAACCGRLDLVMKRWQETDDLSSLLETTQGNKTPVGKEIHPDTLEGRSAVARFLRSKL